jgi:anti-anti-sigma factor
MPRRAHARDTRGEDRMTASSSIELAIHSHAVAVVTLRGEYDLASAERLGAALDAAESRPAVLVDLSACTFVDSSVITALLRAAGRARARDGTLELVVPTAGLVRRALELAGVRAILPLHETQRAALAAIEAAAPPGQRAA